MIYNMKLNSEPFNMIKSGKKTIELRLNDKKRKNIRIGDIIEFTDFRCLDKKILTKVVNIHVFKNFNELYKSLPLDKCGYLKEDINTASPLDMDKYYSVEEQSKYGVLGIEVKVLI